MIVGSAFDTTVDDRIVTNRPSNSPDRASMICRWDIGTPESGAVTRASADATVAIQFPFAPEESAGRCLHLVALGKYLPISCRKQLYLVDPTTWETGLASAARITSVASR